MRSDRTNQAGRNHAATWLLLLLLNVLFSSLASAQAPKPHESEITAFVSVNVVPMDSERIMPDQTVLVEGRKIAAIGASLPVPENARVIDGRGSAFLSPGLADMHTHSDTSEDMKVYLANGVTTVLNMGNASMEFIGQVRPAVNDGRVPGPHIYAAFRVDGSPRYGQFTVTTPEEARAIVRLAKTNGFNFIKVYNNLSPECFYALIKEGRRLGIPIVGHGVTKVGLKRQLDAGQIMVAHAEEFLYTVFSQPDDPETDAAPDPDLIPDAIALIKRNKAFVTADLNTYATIARQWGRPDVVERFMQMPEIRYLAPSQRVGWRKEGYVKRKGDLTAKLNFLRRFTKEMSNASVPLIAGTDAPSIPGLVPGFSLHEDLNALEEAGLTRYQALATATRAPGEFINSSVHGADAFGTVSSGSRADLILSDRNPLDDLSALRKPLGVMANGKWYSATDLGALLGQVEREYQNAFTHE